MSEFFTSTPPLVLHKWLKDRIGLHWSTDFRALARVVDSDIVGVVGYEGFTGMMEYGLPGPFAPGIEEIIANAVAEMVQQTSGAPGVFPRPSRYE